MTAMLIIRIVFAIISALGLLSGSYNAYDSASGLMSGSESSFDWLSFLGPGVGGALSGLVAWLLPLWFPQFSGAGQQVTEAVTALLAWSGDQQNKKKMYAVILECLDLLFVFVREDDTELKDALVQVADKLHKKYGPPSVVQASNEPDPVAARPGRR